jgi:hypothetical protein
MMKTEINLGYIHMESWQPGSRLFSDWMYEENNKHRSHAKEIAETQPDEVILPANETFNLTITYPLNIPFKTELKTGAKGMTREKVVEFVIDCYKQIYKEEDESTRIPAQLGKDAGYGIPYNRVQTDGKYGIWGHCLGDLMLHTLFVNGNKLTVSCDS